ncbi:Putative uncharacterized protein [Moritella viscosa]|nr:hypothetical protein [Moritella viscosa]CED60545.1 putative exported protein [Moritella viscosa]SHO23201.1 Putative uncharacterized protein [Moritella viscosa]
MLIIIGTNLISKMESKMKGCKLLLCSSVMGLSACTVFLGEPDERVGGFSDIELCTELANKTFKYHAGWQWAIADEIKKRSLDTSERCIASYDSRNVRLMRKIKATPVSFSEALNLK